MKERIEQLEQELAELKKQLEEHGFSEGDWLISDKGCHLVRFLKYTAKTTFTSSEIIGSCTYHTGWDAKAFRKATPEEIESALIEEAKRRGFKVGATANNSNVSFDDEFKDYTLESGRNFKYDYEYDTLSWSDSEVCWDVYCKGKWAKIIEEKAKFFEWDVEELNSFAIQIGCNTYRKDFLEDVISALKNVSDHSVQEVINELEKLDL